MPALPTLQAEAARLSLRPTFRVLEPGLWSHGIREGKGRACHLYGPANPFVQASGYGATDAEALAAALGDYRARRAVRERLLAVARRRGEVLCPDGPECRDHACSTCDGLGFVDEATCRGCDQIVVAREIGCTCGERDAWLCWPCAARSGRHLAGCPTVEAGAACDGSGRAA